MPWWQIAALIVFGALFGSTTAVLALIRYVKYQRETYEGIISGIVEPPVEEFFDLERQ